MVHGKSHSKMDENYLGVPVFQEISMCFVSFGLEQIQVFLHASDMGLVPDLQMQDFTSINGQSLVGRWVSNSLKLPYFHRNLEFFGSSSFIVDKWCNDIPYVGFANPVQPWNLQLPEVFLDLPPFPVRLNTQVYNVWHWMHRTGVV